MLGRRHTIAGLVIMSLTAASVASATTLITASEAKLPPDTTVERGITRGPRIVVVSPPPGAGVLASPLALKLRFEAFGNSRIDVESIVVTYKRIPAIDLTQRLTGFISASGIDLPTAEVPEGTHRIRVEVKDVDGRIGATEFTFSVAR